MRRLALASLLLTACWDSTEKSPTGGFTMKLRQGKPPPPIKEYGRWGEAELFDAHGRSCGSAHTRLGSYAVGPVSWTASNASVGGIEGTWDLSKCSFVPSDHAGY